MAHSSSHHVRTWAPITLDVWRPILPPDVREPAHPDSPLQCDPEARGDHGVWGCVFARLLPPESADPVSLRTWEVSLTEVQRQSHAGGEHLEGPVETVRVFLDTSMPQQAPPGSALTPARSWWSPHISRQPGWSRRRC
jgi:hypothetical protein